MIAVLGRRNQTIFLPPELVAGNELEARVKQQLPMIASYKPDARNQAIDKIRSYLIPGAQKVRIQFWYFLLLVCAYILQNMFLFNVLTRIYFLFLFL